jgi:hypothetical protein
MSSNFSEAKDSLLNIGSNVYEDFYKKLVTEEELSLLFVTTLLIGFNRHVYQLIIRQQNNLVFTVFEDNDFFSFFDCYAKCRFEQIVQKFEELKPQITSQPLIANSLTKLNHEFKNNIVKEIIKSCQSVSINYIAGVVKEDAERVQNWIQSNISQGLPAKIDDIDKIVYFRETNKLNATITKALEFSNRCFNNSVAKINENILLKNIQICDEDLKQVKPVPLERGNKHGGNDMDIIMEDFIRNNMN